MSRSHLGITGLSMRSAMSKYQILDLFSGIGGFSLGLERTGGFETVAFCEIEEYPRKVLKKHWPDVKIYEDVRNVTAEQLRADGIFPNVITGGFPCQDLSVAGKQGGIDAERSGLWSECARLLGELRPDYAIFENVTALISGDSGRWFQRVLWDISEVGYDAEWHCIPASELGAHHHRDRVWIICYPKSLQRDGGITDASYSKSFERQPGNSDSQNDLADPKSQRIQGQRPSWQQEPHSHDGSWLSLRLSERLKQTRWEAEPSVGRVVDGVSAGPHRSKRLKGLGNAVVPQIPELIGRAILNVS